MLEEEKLRAQLERLKSEHLNLDQVIAELESQHGADELHVQRLKKRKLQVKDEMARIESTLIPDIIA